MELTSKNKWTLEGRGDVYMIDLKANNLPVYRSEIRNALLSKEVVIDGKLFIVKGIEMFATPETSPHDEVGLLV